MLSRSAGPQLESVRNRTPPPEACSEVSASPISWSTCDQVADCPWRSGFRRRRES